MRKELGGTLCIGGGGGGGYIFIYSKEGFFDGVPSEEGMCECVLYEVRKGGAGA